MRRIKQIIDVLLGMKYYLVVVNRRGTDIYEVNSTMFKTKAEVEEYKARLMTNLTYQYVETISFRSRTNYINIYE